MQFTDCGRRPVAGVIGDTNAGKSTVLSAIAGYVASPLGPLQLTSRPTELVVCERKAGSFFSVVRYGTQENFPLNALLPTMERLDDTAERIILYSRPSSLLERIRLVDLPGVKMSYDDVVRRFLEGPESCDVLLHVVSEVDTVNRVFEISDDSVLPRERVIVINKIDRLEWDDDTCLASVAEETENTVREGLLRTMGNTDLVSNVVACSSLVALAAQVWEDEILQGVLRLAEPGDMAILSSKHFFESEIDALPSVSDRTAILDAANDSLRGPWVAPDYHKPAFPALRMAIGLCLKQGITSTDALRAGLRSFSGIDRLRSVLLKVATSPRIETRRRLFVEVKQREAEMVELRQSLGSIRALTARIKRMEAEIAGNGFCHTEERRLYSDMKTHLAGQESQFSADLKTASEWVLDVSESYLAETKEASEQIDKRREDKCV